MKNMIKYNQFNQAALVAIIVIHNATIYREIYAEQIMNFFLYSNDFIILHKNLTPNFINIEPKYIITKNIMNCLICCVDSTKLNTPVTEIIPTIMLRKSCSL